MPQDAAPDSGVSAEGKLEVREFAIRVEGEPAEYVVATSYKIAVAGSSVVVAVWFEDGFGSPAQATLIWIPRQVLGQTVLRDRDRMRVVMRIWADRDSQPGLPSVLSGLPSRVISANAGHVAISEVGSTLRLYWFAPVKFASKQERLPAEPVLEIRMAGEVLGRLWIELESLAIDYEKAAAKAGQR